MDETLPVPGTEREREVLALIEKLDASNMSIVAELFRFLKVWRAEMGESKVLLNAVCLKFGIDDRVFAIYRQSPEMIAMMEALRRGEPIRQARRRWMLTEEARRWWMALLVVRVLLKNAGVIAHVRLIRWLGHQANAGQVRDALTLLRDAGLVDTYQVKGTDPLRPVTWHRLTVSVDGEPKAAPDLLPAATSR